MDKNKSLDLLLSDPSSVIYKSRLRYKPLCKSRFQKSQNQFNFVIHAENNQAGGDMNDCIKFLWICIFCFIHSICINESAKILAVFPFSGQSQYIFVKQYLETLTVINAYPSKEHVPNYRDIPMMEAHDIQNVKA